MNWLTLSQDPPKKLSEWYNNLSPADAGLQFVQCRIQTVETPSLNLNTRGWDNRTGLETILQPPMKVLVVVLVPRH